MARLQADGGSVEVTAAGGGAVTVQVYDGTYSQAVPVPADEVVRLVGALLAGKAIELHGAGAGLLTTVRRPGWLSLSAATAMTWQDGQYPTVRIGQATAAALARLVEALAGWEGSGGAQNDAVATDQLSGARRRTDENLRRAFG